MDEDRTVPTLESLLRDMIANQHSMHEDIQALHEKLALLEAQLQRLEMPVDIQEDDEVFDEVATSESADTEEDTDDISKLTKKRPKRRAVIHGG